MSDLAQLTKTASDKPPIESNVNVIDIVEQMKTSFGATGSASIFGGQTVTSNTQAGVISCASASTVSTGANIRLNNSLIKTTSAVIATIYSPSSSVVGIHFSGENIVADGYVDFYVVTNSSTSSVPLQIHFMVINSS